MAKIKKGSDRRKDSVGGGSSKGCGEFTEALEKEEPIAERFTCRTVMLDLLAVPYDPKAVKATRQLLAASQGVFAQFLGVSVKSVRAGSKASIRQATSLAGSWMKSAGIPTTGAIACWNRSGPRISAHRVRTCGSVCLRLFWRAEGLWSATPGSAAWILTFVGDFPGVASRFSSSGVSTAQPPERLAVDVSSRAQPHVEHNQRIVEPHASIVPRPPTRRFLRREEIEAVAAASECLRLRKTSARQHEIRADVCEDKGEKQNPARPPESFS